MNFLRNLFSTDGFPPRWHCGEWSTGHGWLHIASDTLIFGAYLAIPAALVYFLLRKRDEIVFSRIMWLFGAFILSCGTTHLVEASLFWHPWYRFSGLLKLITATVSWATVFSLIRIAPKALRLPGLDRVNRELEERIVAQQETERELERRNEELSRFAAVVSHDLKSPLSSAVLFSALAREAVEKGDREMQLSLLGQLDDILLRSNRMVEDVHEYARSGDIEIPLERIDLASTIEKVERDLTQSILESGAILHVESDLPSVQANELALERIFANLLQNAIKYRDPARVLKIDIRQEAGHVEEIIIAVADNGTGIAARDLERIFAPFARACHPDLTPGSGLGLSVCARLLERMGGSISVESEPGKGTCFRVHLAPAGT